jgi:hypothetical protein
LLLTRELLLLPWVLLPGERLLARNLLLAGEPGILAGLNHAGYAGYRHLARLLTGKLLLNLLLTRLRLTGIDGLPWLHLARDCTGPAAGLLPGLIRIGLLPGVERLAGKLRILAGLARLLTRSRRLAWILGLPLLEAVRILIAVAVRLARARVIRIVVRRELRLRRPIAGGDGWAVARAVSKCHARRTAARTGPGSASLRRLADERDCANETLPGGLFFLFLLGVNQGIGEDAGGVDVNQTPLVLAGQRIAVAAAKEADLVGFLEILHRSRVFLQLPDVELDAALILFAAVDEELLALALRLKHHPRRLAIEEDGHGGRHREDEQHGKTGLLAAILHSSSWGRRLLENQRLPVVLVLGILNDGRVEADPDDLVPLLDQLALARH